MSKTHRERLLDKLLEAAEEYVTNAQDLHDADVIFKDACKGAIKKYDRRKGPDELRTLEVWAANQDGTATLIGVIRAENFQKALKEIATRSCTSRLWDLENVTYLGHPVFDCEFDARKYVDKL